MADYKQYLEELLVATAQNNASDLHLSPGHYPIMRIDGRLIPLSNKKILDYETLGGLVAVLLGEERRSRFLSEKETMVSFYQSGLIYPYSRVDAADLVADNYLSAYLEAAQFAKSSYLVSFTYDGGSGINTRFSKVYEKALELIRERGESEEVLENLATEVRGILKDWGVPDGTPLTNE